MRTWTDFMDLYALTTAEAARALTAAGISPDCSTWTMQDTERAAEVLDAAQAKKIEEATR